MEVSNGMEAFIMVGVADHGSMAMSREPPLLASWPSAQALGELPRHRPRRGV
jgi:hypothetical protein